MVTGNTRYSMDTTPQHPCSVRVCTSFFDFNVFSGCSKVITAAISAIGLPHPPTPHFQSHQRFHETCVLGGGYFFESRRDVVSRLVMSSVSLGFDLPTNMICLIFVRLDLVHEYMMRGEGCMVEVMGDPRCVNSQCTGCSDFLNPRFSLRNYNH